MHHSDAGHLISRYWARQPGYYVNLTSSLAAGNSGLSCGQCPCCRQIRPFGNTSSPLHTQSVDGPPGRSEGRFQQAVTRVPGLRSRGYSPAPIGVAKLPSESAPSRLSP